MVEQMNNMACFGNEMREKEFTLKKGVTFLNHGSYGAVPRRIQEAQKRIIDEVYSFPDLWYRRNKRLKQDEALRCIAEFVNADPEDVVFVRNATTGVNSVLKSLHFEPGDVILCTDNTYKAVKNTCEATVEFSRLNDVRTDYLPLKFPIHNEDDVIDMYREYLAKNPKVKIAVIDHITSPSAIKMPIEKLIEVCKGFGVMTLIDGAHAPGQIPLDMKQLDADFYTGNLHKWLYAPTGCAILYVRKMHQKLIRPVVTSHGHKVDFQTDFFYQGTSDESPYCVVPEVLKFYDEIGGYEKIRKYIDDLLCEATELLTSSWKTEKLPIPKSMEAPFMRMVEMPKLEGLSTGAEAEKRIVENLLHHSIVSQITCVDGKIYSRLGCNIYNVKEDYQRLCEMVLNQLK